MWTEILIGDLLLIFLVVVVLQATLVFSVNSTHKPDTADILPIAAIAVDRVPDIQPVDAFTSTGLFNVVPYETGFQMQAGCAFFRAPRHVESSNTMAPDMRQNI